MGWLVKGDKPDFVGRSAVAAFQAAGKQQALVGFEIAAHTVPGEGDAIVRDGALAGRVTSAKWSAFLGKTIGMGWVPVEDAEDGKTISVRVNGTPVAARVVTRAFYDPDGTRLRM